MAAEACGEKRVVSKVAYGRRMVKGCVATWVVGLSERSSALVPSGCLFSVQHQSNQHQSRSHQHANLSSKGWEARRPDTHTDCISGLPEHATGSQADELGNMSRR